MVSLVTENMLVVRRLLVFAGIGLLAYGAWSQEQGSCEQDLAALALSITKLNRAGVDEHRGLLREVRRVQARHDDGPLACRAELATHEVALVNFVDDYPEAIDLATAYLAHDITKDNPDVRAFLLRVRGFARERLGKTVEGAQDYYEAAALAPLIPLNSGLAVLSDAADTAIDMGDLNAAERYQADGVRLLLTASAESPDRHLQQARLEVAQAGLLVLRLRKEHSPVQRHALATRLRALAGRAASRLETNRSQSDDPWLDLTREALAHSAAGVAAAALDDRHGVRAAFGVATRLLAATGGTTYETEHTVWMQAAESYAAVGDTEAAWEAAQRARAEGHESGSIRNEAASLERLALLAEERGDPAHAEALYREALALREVERERLELQDWSATAFAESQAPYRGLARLLAQRGQAREALVVLDQSRARHLRELRAQARLRNHLSPQQRLRVESLLTAIEEARLEQIRNPTSGAQSEAAVRISRLQSELRHVIDLGAGAQPRLDIGALQRVLAQQERTLVSYLLSDHASVAFVVTPDTVVVRHLPVSERALGQWVRRTQPTEESQVDPVVPLRPLHQLYQALVAPLDDVVPPGHGLVFVPDGPLADLSFAMLLERPATAYSGAPYLVRKRAVSSELAAALILEDGTDPAPEEREAVDLVAFGRSLFGDDTQAPARRSGAALTNLPYVVEEIQRVASKVGGKVVALNDEATEPALRRALPSGRVVHLASHAEVNPAFPMHSRIFLWPSADDDGVLHLYEMQAQHVPADLVVLSGCSTASGQSLSGEGTLGLHYGLRAAGAQATLATLWPIDDEATAYVTSAFYDGLSEGLRKDRALQAAQVAYLDTHDGLDASPYFWSAFVLSGSVASVPLHPPFWSAAWSWWATFGALALGGIAWGVVRHYRRVRDSAAV